MTGITPSYSRRKACVLLLTPLLLLGCAVIPPSSEPPIAPTVVARTYHDAIEMGGRLSVRYQQNGVEQAVHGNFTWSQKGAQTDLTLLSPLGQTMATLSVAPNRATMIQSGHPPRTATDVDTLVLEAFGWPFPVSGLRDWLQGFGFTADNQRFMATPGTDSGFTTRDGWQIRYPAWQDMGGPTGSRPRRIDLERETAEAGTVAIRIVLDTWQPR